MIQTYTYVKKNYLYTLGAYHYDQYCDIFRRQIFIRRVTFIDQDGNTRKTTVYIGSGPDKQHPVKILIMLCHDFVLDVVCSGDLEVKLHYAYGGWMMMGVRDVYRPNRSAWFLLFPLYSWWELGLQGVERVRRCVCDYTKP